MDHTIKRDEMFCTAVIFINFTHKTVIINISCPQKNEIRFIIIIHIYIYLVNIVRQFTFKSV